MSVYRDSRIKRKRRTKVEMEALREAIYETVSRDHPWTVRQVFYQLTVKGVLEKTESQYDATQRQLVYLRRNNVIPYDWIADNTRWIRKPHSHSGPEAALLATARNYRRSLWDNQDVHVEVWCEKDALAGVMIEETAPFDVPLLVSKGFSSESYIYEVAQMIRAEEKQAAFVYYFGDRDPSGVKIDPAIHRNLVRHASGLNIIFTRLAVLPEQIAELSLPTRPTKRGDNSHAKDFEGDSVELDAIPPQTLRAMVRGCIEAHVDQRQLEVLRVAERNERELLFSMLQQLRDRGCQ